MIMKQNISDLKPGEIMLVVKNDNGTFSPLGMSEIQGDFLYRCLSVMSKEESLVKDNHIELFVKYLDNEKERDNSNGND